jgi:FkbM family methyltransferase
MFNESVTPLPRTIWQRARKFSLSPMRVKLFSVARRLRPLIGEVPVPIRLSFGSWWLAYDSALDNSLVTGSFEDAEAQFLIRYLRPGMTVLDLGAHHGFYTLLSSKCVGPDGRVIAFEPSPREGVRLRTHVRLNKCRNVSIESVALGSTNGTAKLFLVDGQEDWCNSLRPPAVQASTRVVTVDVISLDHYLSRAELGSIDFIKLDVEGAELEVLKGARTLLHSEKRPVFLAEIYDIRTAAWGYRAHEIVQMLKSCGYSWFWLGGEGRLKPIDPDINVFDATW